MIVSNTGSSSLGIAVEENNKDSTAAKDMACCVPHADCK